MAIVKFSDVGKGVNLDLSPEELDVGAWSNVTNMRFLNGYASKFKGMGQLFTATSITPYYVTSFNTTASRYWVHAGTAAVYADDGTSRYNITPASAPTGAIDDRWASTSLGGILVMTNGKDVPTYWTGSTSAILTSLPNWPSINKCASMVAFKNYLVALNITKAKAYAKTISSITRVTTTATMTTATAHGLATGDSITVSGATPSQYNGTYTVTVTGSTTLTYTMASDPGASASPVGTYTVNTTANYPYKVKWSNSAVSGSLPTSWDETDLTQDGGENDLAETSDIIIDALPLGDSLIVYKERSAYAMRFIGQPYIFSFQRIPGDVGMVGKGCGAVTPVGHVVLTSGDVILNDGQSMRSIADGVIRQFIFKTMEPSNYKRAFVTTNPQKCEALICFPYDGATTCNKAAVWNWQTGLWSLRDLPNVYYANTGVISAAIGLTWASDAEAWDSDVTIWPELDYSQNDARLVFVNATKVLAFDSGATDAGTTFNGVLERKGLTLDDAYTNKLIRAVYPRIDGVNGSTVTIEVGGSMYPDSDPSWSAPASFTVGSSIKADCFARGRFLSLRITGTAPYRVRSIDLDVVTQGAY